MSTPCQPNPACGSCPVAQTEISFDPHRKWDYTVALAGNPNTGKSTVFNGLTGLRQHTGNWPGKTVTRAEGYFSHEGKLYKLVDLPGTYSLLSASPDEEVARDFILFGKPDATVIVADATRLERNLNMVLQVLEITDRAVLCLNLIDEAKRHGIDIDVKNLEEDLGVPVVSTAARRGLGLDVLVQTLSDVATERRICSPHRIQNQPPALKTAIEKLVVKIEALFPGLPNARWVALRILEGDKRMITAAQTGELAELVERAHTIETATCA